MLPFYFISSKSDWVTCERVHFFTSFIKPKTYATFHDNKKQHFGNNPTTFQQPSKKKRAPCFLYQKSKRCGFTKPYIDDKINEYLFHGTVPRVSHDHDEYFMKEQIITLNTVLLLS